MKLYSDMKYSLLFTLIVSGLCCACRETPPATVHLKGQLDGLGPVVVMSYNGAASLLGDSRDIKLRTDAQGFFDTIIPLSEPEYYSIRRNTLYLTPGDDLEVYITDNNSDARFKGKGAEVNEYMKGRLFPKGGSFLESGRTVRSDFAGTKDLIDSLAAVRSAQLKSLREASPEFRELEQARIHADVINSYLAYAAYSKEFSMFSTEELETKQEQFYHRLTPIIAPLIQEIANEEYLDIAVVRDVLSLYTEKECADFFAGISLSERSRELFTTAGYVTKLRNESTPPVIRKCREYLPSVKNEDFKTELSIKIAQASKLLPGSPAINIEMEDKDGNKFRLSDFRGKVLYVDLWATWCGPCIAEAPKFNELSKKFEGKEIVFLQISTDNNRQAWEKFIEGKNSALPQYISKDSRLKDGWAVFYIPRFLLIDKNFNIINAYAELPSAPDIEEILGKAITQ